MSSLRRMTKESLGDAQSYRFLRILGVGVFITACVLIGFAAGAMPAQSTFQTYADIGNEAGLSAFATLSLSIILLLVGGILLLLGALGMMASGQLNNKGGSVCSIIIIILGGGLGLTGGVLINFILLDMTTILCESPTCNPRDSDFSDRMRDIITVELAIFDECCIPNHLRWGNDQIAYAAQLGHPDPDLYGNRVQQSSFGICVGDIYTDNCAGKVPGVVADLIPALVPLLCTCAPDDVPYNKAIQAIRNQGSCAKLEDKTFAMTEDTTVPRVNVKILPLIASQEISFFNANPDFRSSVPVPLVGSPGSAWDKDDQPHGSFGCGLGQPKGYIWWTQLYALEHVLAPANAGIGCSVVALLIALMAVAFMFMGRGDGDDMFNYQDDYNLSTLPSSAPVVRREAPESGPSGAKAAPVSSSVPEAVPATPADRKSVRDLQAKRAALEQRLNEFYAVHEPAKLTDGRIHPDVVNFGIARGVTALNAKLRAKYGTDLDDDAHSESSSGGGDSRNVLGDKLVKRDVDDII